MVACSLLTLFTAFMLCKLTEETNNGCCVICLPWLERVLSLVAHIDGKCSSLLPLAVGQKPCISIVQPFCKLTSLLGHAK